jgi:hypothetical protein
VVEIDPDPVEPPVPVAVAAAVGVVVAVGAPVAVGAVVVVVEDATVQVGDVVMVLASRVTAPLRAKTRPCTVAPESSVAEVSAMMVPTKVLDELRVAELLTCQNTLHAWAPFSSWTTLPDAVTRSDDA